MINEVPMTLIGKPQPKPSPTATWKTKTASMQASSTLPYAGLGHPHLCMMWYRHASKGSHDDHSVCGTAPL
jgi:hypothetical protein